MHSKRDVSFIIGMAGTYDCNRETFFPVFLHKEFLAGYPVLIVTSEHTRFTGPKVRFSTGYMIQLFIT